MSVELTVCATVQKNCGPAAAIERTTKLAELGIDSLDYLFLIGELERIFGIEIPAALLPKIETVGGLIVTIEKLLTKGAAA